MKKFLSLVLAMIMTMSLVTISAGATEYKDLTDKDEIKYEEAVAVLNRIGVITGYEDGSFQPETELTRGAAAKIIVSLMIGPDAAAALPNTNSPYPDVPAGHTFAGVIGFCKTKGYISGYGDGNFKPAGTLTGYAFAKMLLGALGYSSDIERFTGSGWTMNVANVGNVAGLFDRISFDGAAAVTRDEACQLALNTLKATLVTYGGTSLINGTTGTYTIQGTQATPKTSNNRDINANIGRKDWYGGNNKGSDYLTLEFGEEHFKDLRLEHDRYDPAHDEFGRPSNEWSYKKVTIGTFPLEADYTFTTQVAHLRDTDGTKEKALGLRNYDLVADGGYSVWNGWGNDGTSWVRNGGTTTLWRNGREDNDFFLNKKVASIADFTDNGTLVEVYVSYMDADWITDVVVIQTQMMEVKKVASDYVSLDRKGPDRSEKENSVGFNQPAIHAAVEQVKDTNEDCYAILKDLKSGDEVAVIPVTTDDGKTWEAAEVYVPETVSGVLTRVDTYGYGTDDAKERGAVEITVGGTSYKISNWNKDMWDIQAEDIKATRKDVTLLMDKYGNAMLAKDLGATNNFMVIGNFYQALVGNKVCTFVHGWDIGGEEVDLNLGSSLKSVNHGGVTSVYGHVIGELVYYSSVGASGDADYVLAHHDADFGKAVFDVYTNTNKAQDKLVDDGAADAYEIKASNVTLPLADKKTNGDWQDGTYATGVNGSLAVHSGYKSIEKHTYYYDKGVKFIYVNYDGEGEVESVEFKKDVQNVSNEELRTAIMEWPSQAAVKDEKVQAVVIKTDSSDASVNRMLYVTDTKGFKEVDKETNESFFEVEVAMFTADGDFLTDQHIMVNKNLQIGDFATYTKVSGTKYEDNYYRVKQFTRHNTNPAVLTTTGVGKVLTQNGETVKHLIKVDKATLVNSSANLAPWNSGSGANNNQSYLLGGYRGAGTDLFSKPALAEGVIRTDKAEWLDATTAQKYTDIDSAEDLLALGIKDIELDILLNEKPDSDGFRTAYLIVIKRVGTADSGITNTGAVRYADKFNSDGNLGGSITGSIDLASNGNYRFSYSFTAPAWAAGTYNIGWTVYSRLPGEKNWKPESNDSDTASIPSKGVISETNGWLIGNIPAEAELKVEIDSIKYSRAVVRYWNGSVETGNEIAASALTDTGAAAGSVYKDISAVFDEALNFKYLTSQTSKTLTYAVTGLKTNIPATDMQKDTSANDGFWNVGGGVTVRAAGNGFVDVVIDTSDLDARSKITGADGLNEHGGYVIGDRYLYFDAAEVVPGSENPITFHLLTATGIAGIGSGRDATEGEASMKVTFKVEGGSPESFSIIFRNATEMNHLEDSVTFYNVRPTSSNMVISVDDVEYIDGPSISLSDVGIKTASGKFAVSDSIRLHLPENVGICSNNLKGNVQADGTVITANPRLTVTNTTSLTIAVDPTTGEDNYGPFVEWKATAGSLAAGTVTITLKPGSIYETNGEGDWVTSSTETYTITLTLEADGSYTYDVK